MRQKRRRQSQKLNTSSLPDIVFMILFFFMVVGKVPAPQDRIESLPSTYSSGKELKETGEYIHVRVGFQGSDIVAQVGYDIIALDDLTETIKDAETGSIVVLHIGGKVPSGVINNIVRPAILDAGISNIETQIEDEKEN